MSPSVERRLVLGTSAVAAVCVTAGIALEILSWSKGSWNTTIGADLALTPVVALMAFLGALIVRRQPGNLVGRIFSSAALLAGILVFADGYTTYGLIAAPDSLAGPEYLAWVANWLWVPVSFSLLALLPLVFPDGILLTKRWRWALALVIAQMVLLSLGLALAPEDLRDYSVANPLGVETPGDLFRNLQFIGWLLIFPCLALTALSIVLRFRRSHGLERLQVKWLATGAIGVAAIFFVSLGISSSGHDGVFDYTVPIALPCVVLGAGIAVLRYRLYEIDRIVNRTVVYGAVSTLLAGLYFGIVLALQQVFSGFTRGNDLAIAGSTLAVAALFRPARRRIQAFVDRRFYRRRYDAEQTLAAFAGRLRDEVDLDQLGADLGSVVHETMQPAHVSLWLRETER